MFVCKSMACFKHIIIQECWNGGKVNSNGKQQNNCINCKAVKLKQALSVKGVTCLCFRYKQLSRNFVYFERTAKKPVAIFLPKFQMVVQTVVQIVLEIVRLCIFDIKKKPRSHLGD